MTPLRRNDVLVSLGVAAFVVNVPAEGLEERIDELVPELSLFISAGEVGVTVAVKKLG